MADEIDEVTARHLVELRAMIHFGGEKTKVRMAEAADHFERLARELLDVKSAWEASVEAARVEREGYFESLRAAGVALDESISAHVSTRRELAELHRALGSVMRAAEQGDRMIGDADKKPNYAASYDYLRQSIRLNLSTLVKASKAGTDGQR